MQLTEFKVYFLLVIVFIVIYVISSSPRRLGVTDSSLRYLTRSAPSSKPNSSLKCDPNPNSNRSPIPNPKILPYRPVVPPHIGHAKLSYSYRSHWIWSPQLKCLPPINQQAYSFEDSGFVLNIKLWPQ